ncbi:hypothetical protein SRO_0702 [Streptomyces rochei]|nr:hypothetical protein SRO_0702 [Streptomyces rochei]
MASESEAYVGVDAGVGMVEEFLDDDEVDALFEEQGCGRVSEVVEADRPEVGAVYRRCGAARTVSRPLAGR